MPWCRQPQRMPGWGGCVGGSIREWARTVLTLWQAGFLSHLSQVTCLLAARASPYLGYAQQHLPLLCLHFLDKLHPVIPSPILSMCYASQMLILDVHTDVLQQSFVPCGTCIIALVCGARTMLPWG